MQNSFFTGDTHFGHKNIIKYSNRPFTSPEEHDEILIENWNKIISPKDNVYHLGDFAFGNRSFALKIFHRLNGNIHLLEGNHDGAAWQIRKKFIWAKPVHMIKINNQEIWLSHYAHKTWNKSHYGVWHLYGHSHHSLFDDPNSLSTDVGVDAVAGRLSNISSGAFIQAGTTRPEDYRPISFDQIQEMMNKKTFIPIDHHGKSNSETIQDAVLTIARTDMYRQ